MSLNISNSAYLNSLNRPAIKVVGSDRVDTLNTPPKTSNTQQQTKFELSPSQSERVVHLYRANNKIEDVTSSAVAQYLKTENIDQQETLKSSLAGLDIYV